jgi:hypothetical protein
MKKIHPQDTNLVVSLAEANTNCASLALLFIYLQPEMQRSAMKCNEEESKIVAHRMQNV